MPALTSDIFASGISIIPALFEQCLIFISIPFSFNLFIKSLYIDSCLCAGALSFSSAFAKCVKIPSMSMPGSFLIFSTSLRDVSSGEKPILPMPVSSLMWINALFPSSAALADIFSACPSLNTANLISSLMASAILLSGIKPKRYMGFTIPWCLSCSASSMVATA